MAHVLGLQINIHSTSRAYFCPVSHLQGYNYNITGTSWGILYSFHYSRTESIIYSNKIKKNTYLLAYLRTYILTYLLT